MTSSPPTAVSLAIYGGLCAAWIGLIQAIRAMQLPPGLAWPLAQLVLPIGLAALATALVYRLPRPGGVAALLSLGRPAPGTLLIAGVAGLPAVLVLGWHVAVTSGEWLWSPIGALLTLKLLVNQALLEEWLARGMLLGWLVAAGSSNRRAIWLSSAAFALMHMLQYLVPPITTERLLNGLVLVALTLPLGAVLAQLTLRARSIWPAMLLHFAFDLTILPQQLSEPRMLPILLAAIAPMALVPGLLHLSSRRQAARRARRAEGAV